MIDDLDIEFTRPFTAVLDDSAGKPLPKWFVGGGINVAQLCSHRHATGALADKDAVVYEGDNGPAGRSPSPNSTARCGDSRPTCATSGSARAIGSCCSPRWSPRPRWRFSPRDDRRGRGAGVLRLRRRRRRDPHPQLRGGRAGDRRRDDPPRQADSAEGDRRRGTRRRRPRSARSSWCATSATTRR